MKTQKEADSDKPLWWFEMLVIILVAYIYYLHLEASVGFTLYVIGLAELLYIWWEYPLLEDPLKPPDSSD